MTNPAGHWQGTQQIKALYASLSDSYWKRKMTFDTVSIPIYGDFAWTEFTGDFAAKQRKDGMPFSFHAAETQIYRKSHGKWCLVHVQYSNLPRATIWRTKITTTFSQKQMSVGVTSRLHSLTGSECNHLITTGVWNHTDLSPLLA